MKLTEAQEKQKAAIASCKANLEDAEEAYAKAKENHKCIAVKGSCDGAYCAICGDDMGWWCPKSKDHVCHYKNDPDSCIYCGDPEERK